MKKTSLFTLVCLGMLTVMPSFAQKQNRENRQDKAKQEVRMDSNRNSRRSMDMVVDTAVINKMELPAKMVDEILKLQASKQEEMKTLMQSQRSGRRGNDADHETMRKQFTEFKDGYRNQLHKIMGDKNYITYLERVIDARPSFNNNARMRNGNGNMGGGMMGGRDRNMGGGNFGGGFGGGFGGDED